MANGKAKSESTKGNGIQAGSNAKASKASSTEGCHFNFGNEMRRGVQGMLLLVVVVAKVVVCKISLQEGAWVSQRNGDS